MKKITLLSVAASLLLCAAALSRAKEIPSTWTDAVLQRSEASIAIEKIAFHSNRSGTSQIYLMNTDGSEQVQLTTGPVKKVSPAISPDGRRIAFVSDPDGDPKIYLMDIGGGNPHRLTDTPNAEDEPTWLPGGNEVLYRKEFGDSRVVFCIINIDGGNPRQITNNTVRYKAPMVSPEGTQVLFNSTQGVHFEIWVMDIDGSNQHRIENTTDWGMLPCWSPDGDRIAYGLLNMSNFTTEIHVMNSDGTGDTPLTDYGVVSEHPCWSPDGSRIAFQTSRDGDFEIYVIDADGDNPRRLTDNTAFDGWPSWGITQQSGSFRGQQPPGQTPELFAPDLVSTCREHSAAMFTPDGSELWFGRIAPVEIMFMKRRDGGWTEPQVAPFTSENGDLYPTLTSDGNRLYFTSRRPVSPGDPVLPRGQGLLWYVDRTETGWSEPVHFDIVTDPRSLPACVSIASNGNIYFGSRNMEEPGNSSDIYHARFEDGRYLEPARLDVISSPTPDHSPFIAPDESYILWSSFRGGFGRSDLFISFHGTDGRWSEPRNLGSTINSAAKDEYPYVTPDGHFLFFNSNRISALNSTPVADGPGNIYWVDAIVLEALKPPF